LRSYNPFVPNSNKPPIGALVALGGVFTTQIVNSAIEYQRALDASKTEQAQRKRELMIESQRAQDEASQIYLDHMTHFMTDFDPPLQQVQNDSELPTLA
jgi:hypothetical protein